MAFDITKPEQTTLTPEEKTWFDSQIKTASEAAVTKFKTDDETARKAKIPEKYEFKFAEKSPLDPKVDAERIAATARKLGLTAEQAAEYLKTHEDVAGGLLERQKQALQTQIQTWNTEIKNDKDLGGANYNATLASIKRVLDAFGAQSPEFGKLVEETGYGSHPAFVRFFVAIGKAMAEDKPLGGGGGGPKPPEKSVAEVLYGKK